MNVKVVVFFLLIAIGIVRPYDQVPDGVIIKLPGGSETVPRLVKVQVIKEHIFCIIASPDVQFSARPSLIVEKTDWLAAPFTVEEKDKTIRLSTTKLTAEINAQTGEIGLYDSRGKSILVEQDGGGKIITPAEVMGEATQHIQQILQSDTAAMNFEAPPSKAVNDDGKKQTIRMDQ